EDNAAEAEKHCALAVREKTHRDVKRRRHFGSGSSATMSILRVRTGRPGLNLS
ncbi:MAG: hypothetical protein QOG48_790, partial [Verrucomicrobiota bacterium]